jgi:hypothetical protein
LIDDHAANLEVLCEISVGTTASEGEKNEMIVWGIYSE